MTKPNLHVIIASTRPGRAGPAVARWFDQAARAHGAFAVRLVDLAEANLPLLDEPQHPMKQQYQHAHTIAWSQLMREADAFVFVTPEYDFAPPASLVNALQCLSLEWNYAPAGFVGYGGVSGGLRSVQLVKQIASALKMVTIPEGVAIPSFGSQLDAGGAFVPNALNEAGVKTMLDEMLRWTEALRGLRATRK